MYSIIQADDGSFRIVDNESGNTVLEADENTKVAVRKVASITRTMTTDTNLFTLPANAVPIGVHLVSNTESNAGTTAVVDVGVTGTDTEYLSGIDVKGQSGQIACPGATNLGVSVGTSSVQVVGKYAETGTASTAGGPFIVILDYYLP
jgi:hypothetical protein